MKYKSCIFHVFISKTSDVYKCRIIIELLISSHFTYCFHLSTFYLSVMLDYNRRVVYIVFICGNWSRNDVLMWRHLACSLKKEDVGYCGKLSRVREGEWFAERAGGESPCISALLLDQFLQVKQMYTTRSLKISLSGQEISIISISLYLPCRVKQAI